MIFTYKMLSLFGKLKKKLFELNTTEIRLQKCYYNRTIQRSMHFYFFAQIYSCEKRAIHTQKHRVANMCVFCCRVHMCENKYKKEKRE